MISLWCYVPLWCYYITLWCHYIVIILWHWGVWVPWRSSTSGGGQPFPHGKFFHLWSPHGAQLSPMAPHTCQHAAVATPWAMALASQQYLVRVVIGPLPYMKHGYAYPCMWSLESTDCVEEITQLIQWTRRHISAVCWGMSRAWWGT